MELCHITSYNYGDNGDDDYDCECVFTMGEAMRDKYSPLSAMTIVMERRTFCLFLIRVQVDKYINAQ